MPDYRHFVLQGTSTSENYTSTGGGGGGYDSPPRPNQKTHGQRLVDEFEKARKRAEKRLASEPIRIGLQFIPMEFDESSEFKMELDRLESESRQIRVLNVVERQGRKRYLVAVPDDQVDYLAAKFATYRDDVPAEDKRPKNEPLASGITSIAESDLEDYWSDEGEDLPEPKEEFWWEVWLEDLGESETDVEHSFRDQATTQGIRLSNQTARFPERVVILAYASFERWRQFPGLLRHLTEFRRANTLTGEFRQLAPSEQGEFVTRLAEKVIPASADAPAACLLDTGVNRGHPLLERSLSENEVQAWNDEWGAEDHEGHGTELAGLALYGPLDTALLESDELMLTHRLESVKILPPVGKNEPPDYGPITVGSMAKAELQSPTRSRVFCLATTSESDDHWRPTLWSATVDAACSGLDEQPRRLVVAAAGNLRDYKGVNYPQENYLSSIEDPSQAWNVLSVGAYTNLSWLGEPDLKGYECIAFPGALSPASRTSYCWGHDSPWPHKPDVVFEGGNYAKDARGVVDTSDNLQLLTTRLDRTGDGLLGVSRDTSAAAAQAACMAAKLQAEYPEFWAETIRGLIVHSAEWTPRMLEEFPYAERRMRVRVYGMGVPNIERARRCAHGVATMVIQDELQPYCIANASGTDAKTNEMHVHALPIPTTVLQELGDVEVAMRVTLSYFIEPNPPRRGYVARYRYASHGLRFSVRRSETGDQMMNRLSSSFWPEENRRTRKPPERAVSDDRKWDLGPEQVAVRGSIHSDCWRGTAAQLALSDLIAVYPVSGWWCERPRLGSANNKARYSLLVTISTDDTRLPLYNAVEQTIEQQVEAAIGIQISTDDEAEQP